MHQLLQERYTQDDLNRLVEQGKATPFNMRGVGPATAALAERLNQEYAGMFDIKAIDYQSFHLPIHLWVRVDGKDGMSWTLTVSYLLGDTSYNLRKRELNQLAKKVGLVTKENWPIISITRMHPLASYWPEKLVLQMHFLNMPPEKVVAFIRAVEDRLSSVLTS